MNAQGEEGAQVAKGRQTGARRTGSTASASRSAL